MNKKGNFGCNDWQMELNETKQAKNTVNSSGTCIGPQRKRTQMSAV